MSTYRIDYFVRSLSSTSINRILSRALIRLAPQDLELTEIGIGDRPFYSPDFDSNYPPQASGPTPAAPFADCAAPTSSGCWGRRLPWRLLTVAALTGGVVLTIYGGLLVVVGALALAGVFGPPPTDPTALRWHVFVWDLWFMLWGLLLLAAGMQHPSTD